jgi:hypothetical protein
MAKTKSKPAAAGGKPDPAADIEWLDRALREAIENGDQEAARKLFDERLRAVQSRPKQPPPDDLVEILGGPGTRREKLAPMWSVWAQVAADDRWRDGIGRKAVEVIAAALEYLEADPAISTPLVTKEKIDRAHEGLVSVTTRKILVLAQEIEWEVKVGKSSGDWEAAAGPLAAKYGKSPAELAKKLRGHYLYPRSGPIPDGRWTTPQIVEWLTDGGEASRKLASSTLREARKGQVTRLKESD